MLSFYKTVDNRIQQISQAEEGCWISAISPTEEEVSYLVKDLGADQEFVRAALDEEETSRIEKEEDQTLVIVDYPTQQKETDNNTILYSTMPMGIIIMEKMVITVCLKENPVISEMANGMVKNVQPHLKTRFLFTCLLRIAVRYLQYLKQIDKISHYVEQQLHKSMRNKELIQLLGLEKSLVFFSTSLKANEMTLEKVMRGRIIKLYDEDEDILEDVLIEVRQAIEMCNIYSNILSGTMDAFASIIANNLNIVMKVLSCITIVMAVPTIVSSFYGMNVPNIPIPNFWFPIGITIILMAIVAIIFIKKDMFH